MLKLLCVGVSVYATLNCIVCKLSKQELANAYITHVSSPKWFSSLTKTYKMSRYFRFYFVFSQIHELLIQKSDENV